MKNNLINLSPPSFGGVCLLSGKTIPLLFCGARESIICMMNNSSFQSNSVIAVGARQSYGPISVALANGLGLKPQRISGESIDFDEITSTVFVDACISVSHLNRELEKKGYSLLVVPGAENATIGGCIAADVHGKNAHKHGSFGDHVEAISLLDVFSHEVSWVKRSSPFFAWTIGGLGVTGVILNARIKVVKIPGKSLVLKSLRYHSSHDLLKDLINYSEEADDIGAWFSPVGNIFLGKLFIANWSNETPIKKKLLPPFLTRPLFYFIGQAFWRKYTCRLISYYIYLSRDSTYPQAPKNILFPLSGLEGWNKFFGSSFIERQFLVPTNQGEMAIETILNMFRTREVVTPLCAIKIFKGKRCGEMSFANEGISFSIQYETSHKEFDIELTTFLRKNAFPEYLAKMQPLTSSFPSGYSKFELWLDLAKKNKVNSIMHDWLREHVTNL